MALAVGPEGAIWFTDPGDDSVGRVSGGTVSEYPIPPLPASLQVQPGLTAATPKAITAGADGALWITEEGAKAIARVDPQGTPAPTAPVGGAHTSAARRCGRPGIADGAHGGAVRRAGARCAAARRAKRRTRGRRRVQIRRSAGRSERG